MKIYFHHAECSIYQADIGDICELLQIPYGLFKPPYQTANGATTYTYAMPNSGVKESVNIRLPGNEKASGRITLHGSFFDAYQNFPMHDLRDYVSRQNGNIYNLDISYQYDEVNNDIDEYIHMSLADNYKSYLKGSCTVSRKTKPDQNSAPSADNAGGMPRVDINQKLVHYGDRSGNNVKLYQRQGQPAKFEITLRDKKYIKSLLKTYSPDHIAEFETEAKKTLVKHLDFITPESKRAKRPERVEIYSNFIGEAVKPVIWSKVIPAQIENLATENFTVSLSRGVAQLQNIFRRHCIIDGLQDDIDRIKARAIKLYNETCCDNIDPFWDEELGFSLAGISF